jgi:hypothetical protein
MHNAVMSVVLTIRDVPEDVRDLLAQEAREHGQSLQAFVVSVLHRQAAFSRNRQLLAEIDSELNVGGGAAEDAPDVSDVLDRERAGARDLRSDEGPRGRVSA